MSVKMVVANKSNKQAMDEWEEFLLSISNSTTIDLNETEDEKRKRIKDLEKPGNEEKWIKYYFPKFCFCEPAKFHIKSTLRFLKARRMYQSRKWARGLSKSTRRMFEIFYKMFVQKLRVNMLLISKNEGNAIRLLAPYRANLEANQRLINDYGMQERPGKWAEEEFITRGKCSFRAVGMGQNPRGAKLDELRVNVLVFDDADDDEVCRNPDRLQLHWEWVERSAIPTVDISADYYICFDNNVIAEDSLAVRAAAYADDAEEINIRDKDGKSVWPEKNSEADIDYMLSIISYESGQAEYFNDGTPTGKVFPAMQYGKCPPLKTLDFVVVYADPSPSNKDRPTLKSKAQNSCKAVVVIGYHNLKFYVYKCFVDVTTNSNFIDWLYATRDYVGTATQLYTFIENNSLQDPFYEQVLMPLIFAKGAECGGVLGVTPDDRDKPDKYFRIEGTLEPLNRLGLLVLNEDEKEDRHMKALEGQFKKVSPNSKTMDGPDAVEGAVHIIQNKISIVAAGGIETIRRPKKQAPFLNSLYMPLVTKADFTTHIYAEIIDEITRADDTLVAKAITNGEGEAKAYLNRYDVPTMFQTTNTDEFLKSLVKDIASWHLVKLANPNINLELFRTAYEDAIKFLDKVMKGNVDPEWPLKPDDPETAIDDSGHIEWNSNRKRTNHF